MFDIPEMSALEGLVFTAELLGFVIAGLGFWKRRRFGVFAPFVAIAADVLFVLIGSSPDSKVLSQSNLQTFIIELVFLSVNFAYFRKRWPLLR